MNCFTLTAIGHVGHTLELEGETEKCYTKFTLIGNDKYGDKNITTSIQITAFNGIAEALVKHVRKGDQLIVETTVNNNNWIDDQDRKHYDFSFIAQSFKFGAPGKIKRAELAAAEAARSAPSTPADETPPASKASGRTRRGKAAEANGAAGGVPF